MNLGEKIYKLRKEKGLSQDMLAQHLGTTRQAVSKWENDQGYPETEKLLQLSNIFEVSVDFLLKDEKSHKNTDDKGYYVSKEMAFGYIENERRIGKYIGLSFMSWAFSGIPYTMFPQNDTWKILGMAVCIVMGIVFVVIGMFTQDDQYKVIEQEPLIFDYNFMKEFTTAYRSKEKKYKILAIPCSILFLVGIIALAFTAKDMLPWTSYHALIFLGFGIGIFGFIYTIGLLDAHHVLIHNDEYSKRLTFKLKQKFRRKIDTLYIYST